MTAKTISCPGCGRDLPINSPEGLCPTCVLGGGLDLLARPPIEVSADASTQATGPVTRFTATRLRYFGDYELIDEIAHGGMGVVYKARQVSLHRLVALKLISAGALATADAVKRFKAEAEAAASLSHPNIVPIYEIGEHQGLHYFSMGLIEGPNLRDALARAGKIGDSLTGCKEPPSLPQKGRSRNEWAARLLGIIARAMQYAHQRGVLHRDLKPSNILLDTTGQPHLTDFGLAKLIEKESTLTHTHAVLGTPAYMSPEQARGDTKEVTIAADVYGLGAVLYEALTGSPPFAGGTSMETIRQVLDQEPRRPSVFNPAVDRDLETICLKCLEKEPERRYSSAAAFADDLDRWLRSEPITAHPVGNYERLKKWVRRRPAIAALSAGLLLALLVGLAAVMWQWRQTLAAQKRAESEAAKARLSLYAADMLLAQQALDESDRGRALKLLQGHIPKGENQTDLRGWEWRYLWGQCRSDELFTVGTHANGVWCVRLSPDGKHALSVDIDHQLKLWDMERRREITNLVLTAGITAGDFSTDGSRLAVSSEDGTVRLFDPVSWQETLTLRHAHRLDTLAFAPDGKILATLSGREFHRWDLGSGQEISKEVLPNVGFSFFRMGRRNGISPDHKTIALRVVEGQPGVLLWNLERHEGRELDNPFHPAGMSFSPDGQWFAMSSDRDYRVEIWDVHTGRHMMSLPKPRNSVWSLAFSPDRQLLAIPSLDQTVRLWNTRTWTEMATLRGHVNEVWDACFSADGRVLATGSKDGSIRMWSAATPPQRKTRLEFTERLRGLSFSPDGKHFVTLTPAMVRLHQSYPLREVGSFQDTTNIVSAAVSAGGNLVALGTAQGVIRIIKLQTQTMIVEFKQMPDPASQLTFASNASALAAVTQKGRVRMWDLRTHRLVLDSDVQGSEWVKPRFSPNSELLAARTGDRRIVLWRVSDGRLMGELSGHKWFVTGLAFSANGQRLVSTSSDGTARVWDLATQRTIAEFRSQLKTSYAAAFSPDDRRLAMDTDGGPVKLFDLQRGHELAALSGHISEPISEIFFLDADTIIAAGRKDVIVWRAASPREIDSPIGVGPLVNVNSNPVLPFF